MNTAGVPAPTGYTHSQSQPDNTVGQTKHWTQSRTVRAVAGFAVLALGALAGGVAALFSVSTFAAIIAAGAVAVVLGIAMIGYFYHHSGNASTATTSKPPAVQPSATSIQPPVHTPPSMPVQPPPYSPSVVTPPAAYSFSGTPTHPAPMAPALSPTLQPPQAHTPPAGPPPIYSPPPVVNTSRVVPPPYRPAPIADNSGDILLAAEDFILLQEGNVRSLLEQYGHRFYQSSRDGNCFYDSIAHQFCPQMADGTAYLRRQVADFARVWQQRHPVDNGNFSPIEARVFARLQEIAAVPGKRDRVAAGLEEIGIQGCFADLYDIYFASQVVHRPITVIDIRGDIVLAVDENGQPIDWTSTYRRELLRPDAILLVHDNGHFMGAD